MIKNFSLETGHNIMQTIKAIGYQNNLPIDNEQSLQDITLDKPVASGRDIIVE